MAKKILVLGAAGFVGSNISIKLQEEGYLCLGIDDFSFGSKKNISGFPFKKAGVTDLDSSFLNSFDVVISSYCSNIIYAMDKPRETYENNVVNGMKCFSKYRGRIIYLSTSSLYGNAVNFPTKENARINIYGAYSVSKYLMEQYLRTRGDFTTLRLSNVYGYNQRPENPYCGVINRFIYNKIMNKKSDISGGYNSSRDYTFIDDVVDAVVKTIELPSLNQEINIGTSVETSMEHLVKMIGGEYDLSQPRVIDGIQRRCLDIKKAKDLIGWKPKIKLNEGLKLTEKWIKENYVK